MDVTTKYSMLVAVAFAVSLLGSPAVAGDGGQEFGADALIPKMSSGQAYSERYSFAANLDGGGHIGMNFTISNLGIRNGYGAAEVRVELPDFDDYSSSERVSRGNWSYDEDNFGLDISGASVEYKGDGTFRLEYDGDGVHVRLLFENKTPMWQPASGKIENGDDYYDFRLVSPRADVRGHVHVDGDWHEVKGYRTGYADHVATNVAPYDLASRFTRFRSSGDDLFVMWREVNLSDDFGGDSVSWVVVGIDDEIVYEDSNPVIRFGNVKRDEETGYQVPHAIQVRSTEGSSEFMWMLRKDEIKKRDLLEGQGRMVRMIASTVTEPYQFNIEGDYVLQIEVDGEEYRTTDASHVTIDYVN